jgi:hypothetical protein
MNTKKPHLVTRESLTKLVQDTNQEKVQTVIGRALTALLKRQTRSEADSNTTQINNNVGFSGADAYGATLTAKYWLKHKRLEQWQVEKWTRIQSNGFPRLCKYWEQLDQIAFEKRG